MLEDVLQREIAGDPVRNYLIFAAIMAGAMVFMRVFRAIVLSRLGKLAALTASELDDFVIARIKRDVNPLVYCIVAYVALSTLTLAPKSEKVVTGTLLAVALFFGVRFAAALTTFVLERRWKDAGENDFRAKNIRGLLTIIRVGIWSLGVVFLLDNLGFEISAIITGLGIGGVAVALAAQAVLGDLFSYVAIFFDRPFEAGDFIVVGEFAGTVENVGMKTTRLRSIGGEQIVISNSDLTNSRVRNFKRMEQRRVLFRIGVTYETTLEKVKAIPEILKKAVEAEKDTVFDRAHFVSYGNSSLDFECVYFVLSNDYNYYMDIHQSINLTLKAQFEERGIDFAYPTQTLRLLSEGAPAQP